MVSKKIWAGRKESVDISRMRRPNSGENCLRGFILGSVSPGKGWEAGMGGKKQGIDFVSGDLVRGVLTQEKKKEEAMGKVRGWDQVASDEV